MSASTNKNLQAAQKDSDYWGHLAETAIGAALINSLKGSDGEVFYWSGNNREVDFIVKIKDKLIALEVKSGAKKPPFQEWKNLQNPIRNVENFS